MGISWASGFYDEDITDRTVNMWYAAIPGMGPIVSFVMI